MNDIEKIKEKNQKNIDEFVKQLRNAGVKEKTIDKVLKEIQDEQDRQFREMIKTSFENIRKIFLGGENE